jgi:hypothetical protein
MARWITFLLKCKVKTVLLKTVILNYYIASSRFLQLQTENKMDLSPVFENTEPDL